MAAEVVDGAAGLGENEFAVLRAGSQSALTRRVGADLQLLAHAAPEAWGLRARSKEQRFALELLLDPAIEVVALDGRAGTGKTLLAVAAGLEQVVEQTRYERLAIYRPLVPVGRADVGFLPGGLDEKLDPWMAAIHDAVVALTDHGSNTDARHLIDELTARGQLSLESVTFLRGRSLQRQMVVIDEAQNLEPTTLRTILTRVGQGTKVVFTGDTSQIDAPYLGESNNALAVLTQAFSGQSLLRPHHPDRLRAQRRRLPRRRAALSSRPPLLVVRWRASIGPWPNDEFGALRSVSRLSHPLRTSTVCCRGSLSSTSRRRGCPAGATASCRSASSPSSPTARSATSGPRSCACRGRGAGSGRATSTASPAARCAGRHRRPTRSPSSAGGSTARCSPPTTPSSTPRSCAGRPSAAASTLPLDRRLCTMQLSRRLDPDRLLTHGLSDVCARYAITIDRPHDALSDARATAAVLPHLLGAHGVRDEADLLSPLYSA